MPRKINTDQLPEIFGDLSKWDRPTIELIKSFAPIQGVVEGYPEAQVFCTPEVNGAPYLNVAFSDEFAAIGQVAAGEITGLPIQYIPVFAELRHNLKGKPIEWMASVPHLVKLSTKADAMVLDSQSNELVPVSGGSGNAKHRTVRGVFCNVRTQYGMKVIRAMTGFPYSAVKKSFQYNAGEISWGVKTEVTRMAYAARFFLQEAIKNGKGAVALKPTIAQEDAFNTGILQYMLNQLGFNVVEAFDVDYYTMFKTEIDDIFANRLPENFLEGIVAGNTEIRCYIADVAYQKVIRFFVDQEEQVVYAADLEGDRLTDEIACLSREFKRFAERLSRFWLLRPFIAAEEFLYSLIRWEQRSFAERLMKVCGYPVDSGYAGVSFMYAMDGDVIVEQILGTATDLFKLLMQGVDACYNMTVHFKLILEGYKLIDPENKELIAYLEGAVQKCENVYSQNPNIGFFEAYTVLKKQIGPFCPA